MVGGGYAAIAVLILAGFLVTVVGAGAAELRDNPLNMPFVSIAGGCFSMGDGFGEGEKDERPTHEVCVADFALGKYAITRGEFRRFVEATGYQTDAEMGRGCYVDNGDEWNFREDTNWRNPGFPQTDRHPVVCVSWNDAAMFAFWLSNVSGTIHRLPTEAEWEYAARNQGAKERFPGVHDPKQLHLFANYCDASCKSPFRQADANDGFSQTAPVGSFRPNGLGLYDMAGNVWQWLGDWYDPRYYEQAVKKKPLTDWFSGDERRRRNRDNPTGPESGRYKVLRGGSWNSEPFDLRASQRLRNPTGISRAYAGFRLALGKQR